MAPLAALLLLPALAAPARAALPTEEDRVPAPGPYCIERAAVPDLANVTDAKWSPDGAALAVVRFERRPSSGPNGYTEDEVLELVDMRTQRVRSLGSIEYGRPAWSPSGRYLSYWGERADFLEVMDRASGEVVAKLTPSMPEYRWVAGDSLVFVEKSTIRAWSGARTPITVARIGDRSIPHYPADDWAWSGDGARFTLTRYDEKEQVPDRFLGSTASGDVEPLDLPGALYTEWAPSGAILLVRYPTRIEVRDLGARTVASLPVARAAIHAWGVDGRTLTVRIPRASDVAGDVYEDVSAVWPSAPRTPTVLPDLVGARGFSPDGRYFSGVVRTDRHDGQLAVFRCFEIARADRRGAPVPVDARLAAVDRGPGRLLRPVAGSVSQFMTPTHSGVDVAAPFGSPIVGADAGIVTKAEWVDVGGLYVCVRHGGGLETCYYHASTFLVTVGQRVARGQPIALVGMSGQTNGPHVHWEAKLDGKPIDPLLR